MDLNTLEVTEQPELFSFTSIRELVNETLKEDFGHSPEINGLASGFRALDEATGGFQKGQLTTIAVRPGMGKTAFLLSIANNMAVKNNYSLAIFSAERSNRKMTSRLIESETGMSLEKLRFGDMKASERDHMHSLLSGIAKANIILDDTQSLAVEELLQKSRQLKFRHKVDLIIIDYLELLSLSHSSPSYSRNEQLALIVKEIQNMARELDVPVLLFSQTPGTLFGFASQTVPSLKDLPVFLTERSDVLMFLHRGGKPAEQAAPGMVRVDMVLAWHNGQKTNQQIPLAFIESIAKFADLS